MNGRCYFKRSLPFLRIAEQSTALVKNSYVVRSWLYNARTSLPECLLFQCCLQDGGTIHVRESWTSWTRKSPFFWYWYKTKITKEANRVKLLFPVSCSKFVLYFPKYSSIFCQDKAFSWPVSYDIVSSFFVSFHSQMSRNKQGSRNQAGFQSGWEYVEEIADRQTKGWVWTSNIANVCVLPCPISMSFVTKIIPTWVMLLTLQKDPKCKLFRQTFQVVF